MTDEEKERYLREKGWTISPLHCLWIEKNSILGFSFCLEKAYEIQIQTERMIARSKIRECPFCGDNCNLIYECIFPRGEVFSIKCISCDTRSAFYDSEQSALSLWNRRDGEAKE